MSIQPPLRTAILRAAFVILTAAVAACSNGGVSTTPVSVSPTTAPTTRPTTGPTTAPTATPTPTPTAAPTPTATPTAAPTGPAAVACTGQSTTGTSAAATQTLAAAGGSLCIPLFAGFGGTIAYPTVNPSVSITLTSSTTNVASYPTLGTVTPIFYLGITLPTATNFGTGAPAGGGLTAPSILAGTIYTVYGQATIFGVPLPLTPCQTTAIAGSSGGVIGGLGTVLKNASILFPATGVLEIEQVNSGSGPC